MSLSQDRATVTLTTDQIGDSQAFTPEGFLLCSSVRIARTGPMMYAADETPDIEPSGGLMVTIEREADVLFAPDAIASFGGKPVTNDHPDDFVTPETWKRDAIGVVLNPRRGEGGEAEYLLADLLITDGKAIADVRAGKREVSCGYDAEREQIKPGLGRQTSIIGNHVALVDKGRCGPACAIQDKDIEPMVKRTVWDRLRTAMKAKDEAAFEEEIQNAMDESSEPSEQKIVLEVRPAPAAVDPATEQVDDEPGGDDPIAKLTSLAEGIATDVRALAERVSKLEAAEQPVADEDPEEKDDKSDTSEATEQQDSASHRDIFADTIRRAEILAPGIKLPTFDAKAKRKVMADALCDLRRRALRRAYDDDLRRPHVVSVAGARPDFAKMTCDTATIVFRAASELVRTANNSKAAQTSDAASQRASGPMTAERYQALLMERRKAN